MTQKLQEAVMDSQSLAIQHTHQDVDLIHVLLSFIKNII